MVGELSHGAGDEIAMRPRVSSKHRGCALVLLDQSGSMADSFGGGGGSSKAQGVADALNRQLYELIYASVDPEGRPKDHWDFGIIGYGAQVGPAFQGGLAKLAAQNPLLSITEIFDQPIRTDLRDKDDGAGGLTKFKMPIWVAPVANNGTPMAEGFELAQRLIASWVADEAHRGSVPPIVLNLTDGAPNDETRATNAAQELSKLSTDLGPTLLFNCHISSTAGSTIQFPADDKGLPDAQAHFLFGISSVLPDYMLATAREKGYSLADGARGYVFNGHLADVIKFLLIGTSTLG